MLTKLLNCIAVLPQYRLSSNSHGEFPAALQDAITSYSSLLNMGISPQRIIVSGDSAGGHLAISLLRYLVEGKE